MVFLRNAEKLWENEDQGINSLVLCLCISCKFFMFPILKTPVMSYTLKHKEGKAMCDGKKNQIKTKTMSLE